LELAKIEEIRKIQREKQQTKKPRIEKWVSLSPHRELIHLSDEDLESMADADPNNEKVANIFKTRSKTTISVPLQKVQRFFNQKDTISLDVEKPKPIETKNKKKVKHMSTTVKIPEDRNRPFILLDADPNDPEAVLKLMKAIELEAKHKKPGKRRTSSVTVTTPQLKTNGLQSNSDRPVGNPLVSDNIQHSTSKSTQPPITNDIPATLTHISITPRTEPNDLDSRMPASAFVPTPNNPTATVESATSEQSLLEATIAKLCDSTMLLSQRLELLSRARLPLPSSPVRSMYHLEDMTNESPKPQIIEQGTLEDTEKVASVSMVIGPPKVLESPILEKKDIKDGHQTLSNSITQSFKKGFCVH
jgi:hypothetical protein